MSAEQYTWESMNGLPKDLNRITVIWHEMHDFIMTFTLGLLLFSALVNNFTIHFPIKTRRVCRMFYSTTDLMQPVCKSYTPSTRWLIRGNGPMNQSSLLAMYLSSLLLVWLRKFILYVTKLAVVKVLCTTYFFAIWHESGWHHWRISSHEEPVLKDVFFILPVHVHVCNVTKLFEILGLCCNVNKTPVTDIHTATFNHWILYERFFTVRYILLY